MEPAYFAPVVLIACGVMGYIILRSSTPLLPITNML